MRKKFIVIFGVLLIVVAICLCCLSIKNKQITDEEAYDIALKQTGQSDKEIVFKTIKKDDDKKIYEIIINGKEYRYEYEIDMQSGNILKQEKKMYIGKEQAKKLALKSADLKEKNVLTMTVNLENRNDTITYVVSFLHKNHNYVYEINALTGEFINNNIERH